MEIAKKLQRIRNNLNLNQKQFAEKAGIRYSTYRTYENGTSMINAEALAKIASQYNVNLNWLLLGEGQMFLTSEEKTQPPEHTPYELLLAEVLHRLGYYEEDFTQEELATLTNTVEKEVKGTLWDLQDKIFALIRSWKK